MKPDPSEQILAFLHGDMEEPARRAFQEALTASPDLRAELERAGELLRVLQASGDQATADRVAGHIRAAIERRASDIHVVPGPRETVVWLRIDGALVELERLPKDQHNPLIDRWKVLADGDVAERKRVQQGRVITTLDGAEYDLRVTILPAAAGDRLAVRVLARAPGDLDLDALGFQPAHVAALDRMMGRPNGIVTVAGVIGSGRTTVMYSLLRRLTAPGRPPLNIMTVENPVELLLSGIAQIGVDPDAGLTHASALRAILRSDPDVIMAAEIRDAETAELCVEAAVTGHLLLTTLNVNGAAEVPGRFADIGIPRFLVAATFAGATYQRLARRLCPDCAEVAKPTAEERRALRMSEYDGPVRRAVGCPNCHNGYRGRLALFEVMEETPEIRRLIADGAPAEALWREAFGAGGSLVDDARARVLAGDTSPDEAIRVLADYSGR